MKKYCRQITCRSLACLVLIASGASLALAAPASASQNQVSGIQTLSDTTACQPGLTMTGGLIGCWYGDTFNTKKFTQPASGKYLFIFYGTEHFTGCLDNDGDGQCSGDPKGTLYFTFTFTTQTDLTLAEIRGRCHHPVVGGDGDFANATGVLNFHDDVANGTSPYMGHIDF